MEVKEVIAIAASILLSAQALALEGTSVADPSAVSEQSQRGQIEGGEVVSYLGCAAPLLPFMCN